MPEWERDYAAIKGQMIVSKNVDFETVMNEIKSVIGKINRSV
jgi:hypothetical protein